MLTELIALPNIFLRKLTPPPPPESHMKLTTPYLSTMKNFWIYSDSKI